MVQNENNNKFLSSTYLSAIRVTNGSDRASGDDGVIGDALVGPHAAERSAAHDFDLRLRWHELAVRQTRR